MDTLTHTLVGIALSRAGFKNRVPYATTAMIVAANAPDLDFVFFFGGGAAYFAHHRGFSHSLLALPLWAIAIAAATRGAAVWQARRRARRRRDAPAAAMDAIGGPRLERRPIGDPGGEPGHETGERRPADRPLPGWGILFLLGVVGVGSHLLLDLTTAYGTRLLAPFSQRWVAWDIEPILDPWVWALLLMFLLAPMVLGLVGREMGARRHPHRASSLLGLALLAGWWGLRAIEHGRAVALLEGQIFAHQAPLHIAALPTLSTPALWHGVVDLPDRYLLMTVVTMGNNGGGVRIVAAAPRQTLFKPAPSPEVTTMEASRAGHVFLRFARFPLAYVSHGLQGTTVVLTDVRFLEPYAPPRMGVVARFDHGGRLLSARFTWTDAGQALSGS